MEPGGDEVKSKLPKVAKVKNKMPAPVQITAEQLLREAKERELELVQPPPKQKISDPDELKAYRLRKRKGFEDNIRKNKSMMTNWIKYAQWEESQKEIQRCRSVYERALDVDHRNITLWLKYAEMEMRARQVNHARNVWDRAITILPRANQFWYKYTYMEEMLKNVAGARQAFERWMEWEPEEQAWHSYINFELRYKELDRARAIYERFVITHPESKNWIKYAKFEEKNNYVNSARRIYERAVEFFGEENINEKILLAFARFEESQKEHERARVVYKYALDHLDKEACQEVYKQYTIHEKKFGNRTAIEDVIVSKRKFQYEEAVKNNPHDYDSWFDYLRLLENDGEMEQIRDVYERAISNIPPSKEKRHWRRYIYLWINYAVYEELGAQDFERCRQVYHACLELMPHKKFTFAKVWLLAAQFEIRQKNLQRARKILGTAIGKCPKDKLFRGYIDLEIQLREFERCRILYEKFLEFSPENCTTWMKYAELETILGDLDRTRALFELAITQPRLDMPEVLWKAYIDFEMEQEEFPNTRRLYRRLLQRTQHVKVWISFAQFEQSVDGEDSLSKARAVFSESSNAMKSAQEKEERLMLLEAWREFESEYGDAASQEKVRKMMPNRVKKRRKVQTDDGADAGWEEYFDYIFPDDESAKPNLKLLSMAKKWKQLQKSDEEDEDVGSAPEAEEGPSSARGTLDAGHSAIDPVDDVSSTSSEDSDSDTAASPAKKARLASPVLPGDRAVSRKAADSDSPTRSASDSAPTRKQNRPEPVLRIEDQATNLKTGDGESSTSSESESGSPPKKQKRSAPEERADQTGPQREAADDDSTSSESESDSSEPSPAPAAKKGRFTAPMRLGAKPSASQKSADSDGSSSSESSETDSEEDSRSRSHRKRSRSHSKSNSGEGDTDSEGVENDSSSSSSEEDED